MPKWRWALAQLTKRLWWRATLIGLSGVAAAIVAAVAERFIPWQLPTNMGADAVESILHIIASSMLAATTFSLSVMTSAYGSATSNVTPRATKLVMEDRLTHTVLSTFVGAFLFSMVGIVVLKTGAYGERGRFVLFAVTVVVLALIVISLLRWIDHLTRLGRVGETTQRVEEAASNALKDRAGSPYLGCRPLGDETAPRGALHVPAGAVGYVQHVDMDALSAQMESAACRLHVLAMPGSFVFVDTALAVVFADESVDGADEVQGSSGLVDAVRSAFTVGQERSFDQDPRFGLVVMSEIASRALSPATNDPGTAIDIIGRHARLLASWAKASDAPTTTEPKHPRIYCPALSVLDLFEDAFMLIARDGAHLVEIQLRLQKVLNALARIGNVEFQHAARLQANMARERAMQGLQSVVDRTRFDQEYGRSPR